MDSINEQSDKLAKRKADEEYRVFIKGRSKHFVSGLGYVWTNNPNGVTPEEIRFAIKFQQQINPSVEPKEDMTVTIMKSIKAGIDPITGNKLTTMQSTNWLFTLLLLSSKLTKGGKVVNFKGTLTSPNIIRKYQGKLVNKNSAKVNSVKKASGSSIVIKDGSHLKNDKLKSNINYRAGENSYHYKTDNKGRITNAESKELKLKAHEGRQPHNSKTPDKRKDDHAGHLFADRFGGSPELDNLVSQAKKVNLNEYKRLENIWARALKEGKKVSVDIKITYPEGSRRPSAFEVTQIIDGKRRIDKIFN